MLYKLYRKDSVRYDEYDAKVVRAGSIQEAREIANLLTGDEGQIWDNVWDVHCDPIDPDGPPEEILGSYNAG